MYEEPVDIEEFLLLADQKKLTQSNQAEALAHQIDHIKRIRKDVSQ